MKYYHYSKNKRCICGRLINNQAKRCLHCSKINILNPCYKKGLPHCEICDKELSAYTYRRCNKHKGELIAEKKWRGGLPKCIHCGKLVSRKEYKRCRKCWIKLGRKYPICTCGKKTKDYNSKKCNKCYLKSMKGKNHPMFGKHHTKEAKQIIRTAHIIHGLSYKPYPLNWNNELKEYIRARDHYKCQKCNKKEENLLGYYKKLHVHHINYNKLDLDNSNLISLCSECHRKTFWNRDYWFAYYIYIMENK
jgi:hypothetical protein